MTKLFLPIILATAREGRWSEKAANFVKKIVEENELETQIVDVKDYKMDHTIPYWHENKDIEPFKEIFARADGVILVSPEYNHSFPGEFKILFDSIYEEFNKKPIAICGVSDGSVGGARVVEQLRLVAIAAQMVPTYKAVYFTNVDKIFDENGQMKDENFERRVNEMLVELSWYAEVLKKGREGKN